jgi:hypothetical protein
MGNKVSIKRAHKGTFMEDLLRRFPFLPRLPGAERERGPAGGVQGTTQRDVPSSHPERRAFPARGRSCSRRTSRSQPSSVEKTRASAVFESRQCERRRRAAANDDAARVTETMTREGGSAGGRGAKEEGRREGIQAARGSARAQDGAQAARSPRGPARRAAKQQQAAAEVGPAAAAQQQQQPVRRAWSPEPSDAFSTTAEQREVCSGPGHPAEAAGQASSPPGLPCCSRARLGALPSCCCCCDMVQLLDMAADCWSLHVVPSGPLRGVACMRPPEEGAVP